MTQILHDILDVYVVVYINDLLIFSVSEDEHVDHVREVLRRLRENNFFAKLSKCTFHVNAVEFLGFIVSGKGLHMAEDKVSVINVTCTWPRGHKVFSRF